ncbi:hypothetical protein VDG1235_481 [Verrucomicrobiia bacterium DG1235]|nr:hypothetical protein VDG1235_481 [Verrucomicrobiae bacterium DG1235]
MLTNNPRASYLHKILYTLARLIHNDPMEINHNRLGTSIEAAIVWI